MIKSGQFRETVLTLELVSFAGEFEYSREPRAKTTRQEIRRRFRGHTRVGIFSETG